jgi:hypothetical protein
MVYVGQLTNYEEGVSLLQYFYGIEISKTQLFRVTNCYGEQIGSRLAEEQDTSLPAKVSEGTIVYAECDGSMILTRKDKESGEEEEGKKEESKKEEGKKEEDKKEEGNSSGNWSEVKLCRIYKSTDRLVSGQRSWIDNSEYISHLGSHNEFKIKAERELDKYEYLQSNLVFISDGATWIHNWQTEKYPKATQILDYYHVCEHLATFAKAVITDDFKRSCWLKDRKDELLESQSDKVIKHIKKIIPKNTDEYVKQEANKLIYYYTKNKNRMDYKN